MSNELSKTYDPAAVESAAYKVWLEENLFHADPNAPGRPYCIVIPPPNVTGALHLGHAINNTLQDILTRVHRMMGVNTVWIPGLDHAGIATQAVVEKQLKEKENKTATTSAAKDWSNESGNGNNNTATAFSNSSNAWAAAATGTARASHWTNMCAKAVRETFFKLFKDGLIYRGKRLVNWDIQLQTSISDDEIYHETVKTNLWHIQYPIVADFPLSQYAGREPG